jgi:hypothetical protein
MSRSSWASARRATAALTAGEVFVLAVGAAVLAFAREPAAAFLAGAALAPLLSLVTVLTLRGSEPLRAFRFLVRLGAARAAGALVAGALAALLHRILGYPWMSLAEGFAFAVPLELVFHPWVIHAAARRASSCRAVP